MRSRRFWALPLIAALLLAGCATGGADSASAPTVVAESATPTPRATPASTSGASPSPETLVPGSESDDVKACQNVNRAANFLFTAAAESEKYTDDPERLYRGGMALLFAGANLTMSDDVTTDLGAIVEIFTERSGTTVDGVEPYWDVATAYVADPDANPLTEPLAAAAGTCADVGYEWQRWSVDS